MRHHSPRSGLFRRWLTTTTALAGVLPVLALTAPAARANPEGGSVVQGAATITQTNPKTVTVNQTTDKAVINWRSFSIGADETTRFNQPSSSSTTLNRVTGDQVSKILGNLSANGKVFLVNPNGIVFGAGSKIDVAALVASTADIKNENFMAGNLRFDIPGKVGAEIINQGTITAADGGLVALVSPVLRNSGIIQARLGKVALASANGVTLDLYGDNLILFQATDKITQQMVDTDGKPVNTAIDNSGQIYADGGRVLMTANTAKGLVDNAINTTGLVSARAVEQQGGEIVLKGEDGGIVQVAGRLDASGTGTGQTGGKITVQGDGVTLADGASLDASGDAGGGKVTVGSWNSSTARMASGAAIDASAKTNGNGGDVSVIAANADVAGSIRAKGGENGGNGGSIETSGHFLRIAGIKIDTSATHGATGTYVLDPTDYTIGDGGNISGSELGTLLSSTNVTIQTVAQGSGTGDIHVNAPVTWASTNQLSLSAYRDILVRAAINGTGGGSVLMRADNTGSGIGTVYFQDVGNVSVSGNGSVKIYYNAASYNGGERSDNFYSVYRQNVLRDGVSINDAAFMLVNNVYDLQGINTNSNGYYALGRDISAAETVNWNGGQGFAPLGDPSYYFRGYFDGLGHKISDLYINRPASNFQGLFYYLYQASIKNVGLEGVDITGNNIVGGLSAGIGNSVVSNVYSTGSVKGRNSVGGIAGQLAGGTISDAYTNGSVAGTEGWIGGLVGYSFGSSRITQSYSAANVSGEYQLGGLVGLAGNTTSLLDSYSTGDITGKNDIGGIAGSVMNNVYIKNVYSVSRISASTSIFIGGLVGNVQLSSPFYFMENGYWNRETSGVANAFGRNYGDNASYSNVTSLSNGEMASQARFSGFDFSASGPWSMGDDNPNLRATKAFSNQIIPSGAMNPVASPPMGDNPLMGLDAKGLYATILANNWAGSYSTNSYWLAVAEASGAVLSDAQKEADTMLQAWNRYKSYSGQALADRLYQDYLDQSFKINNTRISNSPANPIWYGAYGGVGSASDGQKTANVMIQSYNKFKNATADDLFSALVAGRVKLDGLPDWKEIVNSRDNVVWRGIYGADMQASSAQQIADVMMVARQKYANNLSALKTALMNGDIAPGTQAWRALMDDWETGSPHQSDIQKSALLWLGSYTDDGDIGSNTKTINIPKSASEIIGSFNASVSSIAIIDANAAASMKYDDFMNFLGSQYSVFMSGRIEEERYISTEVFNTVASIQSAISAGKSTYDIQKESIDLVEKLRLAVVKDGAYWLKMANDNLDAKPSDMSIAEWRELFANASIENMKKLSALKEYIDGGGRILDAFSILSNTIGMYQNVQDGNALQAALNALNITKDAISVSGATLSPPVAIGAAIGSVMDYGLQKFIYEPSGNFVDSASNASQTINSIDSEASRVILNIIQLPIPNTDKYKMVNDLLQKKQNIISSITHSVEGQYGAASAIFDGTAGAIGLQEPGLMSLENVHYAAQLSMQTDVRLRTMLREAGNN